MQIQVTELKLPRHNPELNFNMNIDGKSIPVSVYTEGILGTLQDEDNYYIITTTGLSHISISKKECTRTFSLEKALLLDRNINKYTNLTRIDYGNLKTLIKDAISTVDITKESSLEVYASLKFEPEINVQILD